MTVRAAYAEEAHETKQLAGGGWGPGRVVGGLGCAFAATLIATICVSAVDPDLASPGARLSLQALFSATLASVAFGFAAGPGRRFASPAALGLCRSRRRPYASMAIAYGAYFVFALLIAAVLAPEQQDIARKLGFGQSSAASAAALLLIVFAAPLSEEIFFRGFVFAGLADRLPLLAAATVSSLIWGLLHYTGPGSWPVAVQIFGFGLALSWLYARTGSLWPTIAVHTLNNGLAFALLA